MGLTSTMNEPTTHLNVHDWQPLTLRELREVLRGLEAPWWIAGGWAIDLFLGRQTRPHEDLDVLILRRDQLRVQQHLHGWRLYKTKQPTPSTLAPWPANEFLAWETGVYDIWAKQTETGGWRFQLMLMEDDTDRWVFRRDPRIGGRVADLGWMTDDGLPVLRPAVQLLYKGRLESRRPKDDADFAAVLPHLAEDARRWLADELRLQFGARHPWIVELGVTARTSARHVCCRKLGSHLLNGQAGG